MAGIRINNGAKKIEVNDSGDYIILNLNDNDFLNRFYSMYENVQKTADEMAAKETAIQEKQKDKEDNAELLKETFRLYTEFGKDMMSEVDGLFGDGTCKKVFGDIAPTIDLYIDFFEQLVPYLNDFAKEKMQRMSKYSAARRGNV
ncbi:MAG: hypothetical protein HFF84_09735 [Oscillibacter sp.]|nr:hypothetical protein [Oscillibacter sp.]